jgi:choice-of-anchor B domain-containing protein
MRFAVVLAALGVAGRAVAEAPFNAELLSHVTYPGVSAAVWGYSAPDGTELAMFGTVDGTSFQDVTDPRNPRQVAFIEGNTSTWREMRTWSHYAYIVTEGYGFDESPNGMQIVDLADPQHPRLIGRYDATFSTAHSLGIYEGYAYINGSKYHQGASGMRILDLADPEHPVEVGVFTGRYVHDGYVRQNIGYLCAIGSGLSIVDLSDKQHPTEISFTTYLGAYTHNAWTTTDGTILYTTDETASGHLRIWDVTNPYEPYQGGEWSGHPTTSIHNVVVRGDSAYVAYYTEGLKVLDISNPEVPVLVASYDTYPGISGGWHGCWGVYPFARSGNLYVSDIEGGLFIVALRPPVAVTLQDLVAEAEPGAIRLRWQLHRAPSDQGALRISRAAGERPFVECARLDLDIAEWRDPNVVAGESYTYRLELAGESGLQSLGEVRVTAGLPARSRLLGNVPNPFNPSTQVRFELARPGAVQLYVYDVRGRLLRQIERSDFTAGAHELLWDGHDSRGRELPSGAYLYEIRSLGWSARGRMTLAK